MGPDSETLALYKSLTYLLTYTYLFHPGHSTPSAPFGSTRSLIYFINLVEPRDGMTE